MQLLQGGAGVGAQFLGQPLPGVPVALQRVGLATGPEQRQHHLPGQPFVQRVLGGSCDQFGQEVTMVAAPQCPVGPVGPGSSEFPAQVIAHRLCPRGVQFGQGLVTPQRQRVVRQRQRASGVVGVARVGEQAAEPVQVDRADQTTQVKVCFGNGGGCQDNWTTARGNQWTTIATNVKDNVDYYLVFPRGTALWGYVAA